MPKVSVVYLPRSRGCLARVAEIGVLAAAVAAVALHARRETIDCAWVERVASCRITTVGAFEMRKERVIDGIHGMGHRAGTRIHFVTDARNKDDLSPFGMRQFDAWDERTADSVEAFLNERTGTLSLAHGPLHPGVWTAIVMLGVLVFAWMTRPLGFLVTIDPENRALLVRRRGPLFETRTERYALSSVRRFTIEEAKTGRRVRLELDGKSLPLTGTFSEGEHHGIFVARAAELLKEAR